MKKKKTTRFLALALSALLLSAMPFSAGAEDGIFGDANEDSVVDATDAAQVLMYAARGGCIGTETPADYGINEALADVNEDGELDASDASQILILAAEEGVQ